MNPVLLKGLIGISALGTTAVASVGGYYWLSAPKTIGEKIKDKVPLEPYNASDSKSQEAWKSKKDAYTTGQENVNESILSTSGVTEQKISDECQKILKISLNTEDTTLEQKEEWAKKWCFK